MIKIKKKILIIILPIITIVMVFGYGYYRYKKTVVISHLTQKAIQDVPINESFSALEKLDKEFEKDKNYLSSVVGVFVEKDNDLPQNLNVGGDNNDTKIAFNALKEQLKDSQNELAVNNLIEVVRQSNSGLLNSDKASQIMINIAKYIAVSELKKLISLGLNYEKQLEIVEKFAINDIDLFNLIAVIKKNNVPTRAEIMYNFVKISEKLSYEIYLQHNTPSFLNKALFKIKKYVGVKKDEDIGIEMKIIEMLKKEQYKEILEILNKYTFMDPRIIAFRDDIAQINAVDLEFLNTTKAFVLRLSHLSKN
jgi:hypothetical protein